ncbi:response regulator [bacterium]|nr:response regulator [bacterium]
MFFAITGQYLTPVPHFCIMTQPKIPSDKVRIFLVDDEKRAIDTHFKALTQFIDGVEIVGSATAVDEAYDKIIDLQPDLLLLDIEMGNESGFQLLEKFDELNFHVAFVTAHENYALKAIKFSAIDYVIKPASISDLKSLIEKVRKNPIDKGDEKKVRHMMSNILTQEKSEHKLTIALTEGYEFVKIDDIITLKADGSYTQFQLQSGEKLTTSKNLKYFESILEDYGFYRIHNSSIINLRYIKRVNKAAGGSVLMENNDELSISKSRKEEFMNRLSLK